jgi:hypothetical protein
MHAEDMVLSKLDTAHTALTPKHFITPLPNISMHSMFLKVTFETFFFKTKFVMSGNLKESGSYNTEEFCTTD